MVKYLQTFLPKNINNVLRTTITYWIRKYSTLAQQNKGMTKLDEIKKLKERIEELELICQKSRCPKY